MGLSKAKRQHMLIFLIMLFILALTFVPGLALAEMPSGDSQANDNVSASLTTGATAELFAQADVRDPYDVDQWADDVTKWKRLGGKDAYGTMVKVVNEGWTKSDTVVIAAFDGYWDALAASALAGSEGAPVLLTGKDSLAPETASLIESLGAKKAYICGGEAAIGPNVANAVKGMGLTVERFGGEMAFNTAEIISARAKLNLGAGCDTCVIATIDGFYDSLSVAPAAYSLGMPVYLTGWDKKLADSTVAAIKAAGYKNAVIVGGPAAVLPEVEGQLDVTVTRLWGQNAWETSEAIAEWGLANGLNAIVIAVADGNGYWDALTGAPLVGHKGGSLVLVPHDGMSSDNKWYFSYNPYCIDRFVKDNAAILQQGYVFGGEAAVSKQAYDACVAATATSGDDTESGEIEIDS